MKILLCKPKYIGDTLLLTGVARAIRSAHPDAEVWVAVREGTEGILAGSRDIAGILTLSRPKEHNRKSRGLARDFAVIRELRRQRFDFAFELSDGDRGRFVTALSGARRKIANRNHFSSYVWRLPFSDNFSADYTKEKRIDWDYGTVAHGLGLPPATPVPIFERDRADFSFAGKPERPTLFVHPAASQPAKMWPEAKWRELISGLTVDFDIILSCGPAAQEVGYCEKIITRLPDASRIRFTGGGLSWPAMAGALYSSVAYIGADTAAMHLASACSIPVLGIFGGNAPEHLAQWTPRGDRVRVVTFTAAESGIADIPVARVREALDTLSLR